MQQLAAQLPWWHNVILLKKLKQAKDREWYARKALEHGWSRAILDLQIETRLHEREGMAITNFSKTLPPAQSDLAQQLLKDPYTFEFLTIDDRAKEREVEKGLMDHVQKMLLELGTGFAFVGRQVRFEVDGEEFRIEYALRDINKPMGVAEWTVRPAAELPKELRDALPTLEQIQERLNLTDEEEK